jgi:hypothetical protein
MTAFNDSDAPASRKQRLAVVRGLFEKWAALGILLVYFAFQVNAALHHGSWGQDYSAHVQWIQAARTDPWHFATHFDARRPEPPLFHLLGAAVLQVTNGKRSLETIAFLSIVANLFALLMTYRLIRQLIENWILQLACLMFIAFLPCIMIHAVVLASDAFTLPIFVGILTLLAGLIRSRFTRGFWPRVLGIATLLALGIGTKFTFESQAVGVLATLCVFPLHNRIEKYRALRASVLIGAVGVAGFVLVFFNLTSIRAAGITGFAMTPRDILFFHPRDVHIFRAPEYAERLRGAAPTDAFTPHGPYELLVVHTYSYPALLHLAIFTDILNIYQDDPSDNYFGTRTRTNASRMRIAVKCGLIFSLSCFFLTALGLARTFYLVLIKRKQQELPRFSLALCGLGWFLNIVVFLPWIPAYWGGFWLPRLILPALLVFIVLSATELDRLFRGRRQRWSWVILALVVLQSAIQLSFLWPHGPIPGSPKLL